MADALPPQWSAFAARQARDARVRRIRSHAIRESENFSLDALADPRAADPAGEPPTVAYSHAGPCRQPRHLRGLSRQWHAPELEYDPKQGPCPECGVGPGRDELCLVCHRTQDAMRPEPMRDARRELLADRHARKLAGGTGAPAAPRKAARKAQAATPAAPIRRPRRSSRAVVRVVVPILRYTVGQLVRLTPEHARQWVDLGWAEAVA